jgi:hypothetical protein
VLFVVGGSLKINSSTTICNINYIKGFVENGYKTTVLMPSCVPNEIDQSIPLPSNVTYVEFKNRSRIRKMFASIKRSNSSLQAIDNTKTDVRISGKIIKTTFKKSIINKVNYVFKKLTKYVNVDPERVWIKNASKYKSDKEFDLIISLSFPVASHQVALNMIQNKTVKYKSWIQIWTDPWSNCLYANKYSASKRRKMRKKEDYLLSKAEKVVYVSPLTLENQKVEFSNHKSKMSCIVLPSDNYENSKTNNTDIKCGYFGEYFSYVRNIIPFYNAVKSLNISARIVGGSDIQLERTDKINIEERVPYSKCKDYEREADILVNISNLSGGQIPGKIYYYSATNKYILFVLDGTKTEIETLYKFFNKYDRYVFCHNNEESIINGLKTIMSNYESSKEDHSIDDFIPKNIANQIIDLGYIYE